ncbi:hypothetical protein AT245_01190 [Bartonella henselae]|nr:hypothetical protein AT244_06185 [Bartonella henselae]OLL44851.1 hypothetical protein AT245_01190 [Bartonella henselae]OLL53190.1 hypothetical protein AT240_03540 [Bartonella henselae]OLL55877.1 hypothetical protein AT239_05585 [Bartonella henselae]
MLSVGIGYEWYKVKSTESCLAYVYEVINYSGALIVFDQSEYGFSLVFQSFVRVILVFAQRFFCPLLSLSVMCKETIFCSEEER